jgi:hypothetical protein
MMEATYTAAEAKAQFLAHGLAVSRLYRRVHEGAIKDYLTEGRKRGAAYSKADVDRVCATEGTKGKRLSTAVQVPTSVTEGSDLTVDIAGLDDLIPLYLLETDQDGIVDAFAIPRYTSPLLNVNKFSYLIAFDPRDRKSVVAMLGVVPVRSEVLQQLLKREIVPSQITAKDVIQYKSGKTYNVYIVSAATKPEQKDAIMLLVRRLFAYWQENRIIVESIHLFIPTGSDGKPLVRDTPLMRIAKQCYFTPSPKRDLWELRPEEGYQPADFVENYQLAIEAYKGNNHMLVLDKLDELREIYQRYVGRRGHDDLATRVRSIYAIDDAGNITRRDGRNEHKAWIGPVRNDNDIRATLRINAGLFGDSKRFTEDQHVAVRRAWLQKNPDIYRILEIDGEVAGFITAFPFTMDVIVSILKGEIRVGGNIPADQLQVYEPGREPVGVYVQTVGLKASIARGDEGVLKNFAGSCLIAGMERLLEEVGGRGVEIEGIYTRSDERDGLKWIGAMGFDEMPEYSEVAGKLVFHLDFTQDKTSLRGYKEALAEYNRAHAVQENV